MGEQSLEREVAMDYINELERIAHRFGLKLTMNTRYRETGSFSEADILKFSSCTNMEREHMKAYGDMTIALNPNEAAHSRTLKSGVRITGKEAVLFTLAHEIAHFVYPVSEGDMAIYSKWEKTGIPSYRNIPSERIANQFAEYYYDKMYLLLGEQHAA